MKHLFVLIAILVISFDIQAQNPKTKPCNVLTKKEIRQGWQLLFDGHTMTGWKGYKSDQIFTCWSVADGELTCKGEGGSVTAGDIITLADFGNFALSIDWCISKAGNSGIFYHVLEGPQYQAAYETGPEYQLIDDNGWPGKLEDWQQTGADYAMYPAIKEKKLMPAGKWNHTCIIYNQGHVEYWLNGMKVVEFQAYSPEWEKLRSSGKWKDYPDYAISKTGHIGLQNHGSGVKFRNIKVRRLN